MKQTPPRLGLLDGIPTRKILEGLALLHRLVLVADAKGYIVWMSDPLAAICGGTPGDDARRLCSRLPHLARTNGIETFQGDLKTRDVLTDVRIKLQHKDGGRIEADASAFQVENGEPDKPFYIVVARPVGERERGDHEPRNSAGVLAALLENTADGVVATDRAGFITYANPAVQTLLDLKPEELIGKPAASFLSTCTGFGRVLSALQTWGEVNGEDISFQRADGTEAWISISSRALRLPGGEVVGTVSNLRDVTERRRIRKKLECKNAELESYVHSVSHDLRSPLVSLLGFSRLLRQDYEGILDETGRHFLDRIEQASRTMEALISDLLELSRIGATEEYRSLIDPRPVLLQLQAEFKPQLEERGIQLRIPAAPPLVFSDRTRLYQVFSNLIGNALSHMGPCEKPEIRVEIGEYADHHLIVVSDNGKGIPPKDHERIFELFRTLASPRDERRSTGVGLAIVKKIVETQDGRIWVESAPGLGARFLIALPNS